MEVFHIQFLTIFEEKKMAGFVNPFVKKHPPSLQESLIVVGLKKALLIGTVIFISTLLLIKRDGYRNVGDQFHLFLVLLGVLC